MSERDRLIDTINIALKEQFDFVPLDKTIKIADRLLANGVIVLPCGKGTKLNYDGIDYEVDHWNIIASAFNDKAKEQGKSGLHLFDAEEVYKALEEKNE